MLQHSSSLSFAIATCAFAAESHIGQERSVTEHLADHEKPSVHQFLIHGKLLFNANWTEQEGGGRPLTKGTRRPLSDLSQPLSGALAFNRISGPDANSCAGRQNAPYGISGGGGDFVTNIFILGQRFDSVTFDPKDTLPTRGTVDESGQPDSIQTIGNLRSTTGMFGAGYLEILGRQMTEELQIVRDFTRGGHTRKLTWTKSCRSEALPRLPITTGTISSLQYEPAPKNIITATKTTKERDTLAHGDVSLQPAVHVALCLSERESASRRLGSSAALVYPQASHSSAELTEIRKARRIALRSVVANCYPGGAVYRWRTSSLLAGTSETKLAFDVVKCDKLAARDLGVAFTNSCPIGIAQRLIAPSFRQKMEKPARQTHVVFRECVKQTVEFFVRAHVPIVNGRATA